MSLLQTRWFGVPYEPDVRDRPFLAREVEQHDDDLSVRVAVLDDRESDRFFGVPLARRGIQPVWLRIVNCSNRTFRLRLAGLDPNYFPPLEAAFLNHFGTFSRLTAFGLLGWWWLPLLLLLPLKVFAAWSANKRMNSHFQEHAIGWGFIQPGTEVAGFVFTSLDEGTKQVSVQLMHMDGMKTFSFGIPVPGLRVDHGGKRFEDLLSHMAPVECDEEELRKRLAAQPRSTTNRGGAKEGDPLNLIAIGDFATILTGFGARWDETETISLSSCWRTFKAFLFGTRYRYSPVSSLYVGGRCQDFALQKIRHSINQRMHLRLWMTPLRFKGKPVWVGQVSRDIGVRFTWKTWNLTTHKIDPDVDDARDYVLDDLMESGRVAHVGYVPGAGAAERSAPRHNLTGDPYFTDGLRAVAVFSETRTNPTFLNWKE